MSFEEALSLICSSDIFGDRSPSDQNWLKYTDAVRQFLKFIWDKDIPVDQIQREMNCATYICDDDKWELEEFIPEMTLLIKLRGFSARLREAEDVVRYYGDCLSLKIQKAIPYTSPTRAKSPEMENGKKARAHLDKYCKELKDG